MTTKDHFRKYRGAAAGGALAATAALGVGATPTYAAGVEDVTAVLTSLTGIAGAATTLILVPMGVRMAIKIINRVAVKG